MQSENLRSINFLCVEIVNKLIPLILKIRVRINSLYKYL